MDNWIRDLRNVLKLKFPDAVSVEVFVNSEGIEVRPIYKGELAEYSMKKMDGTWCSKQENR